VAAVIAATTPPWEAGRPECYLEDQMKTPCL